MAKIKKKIQKTDYLIKLSEWEYQDINLLLYAALHPHCAEHSWNDEMVKRFRKIYSDLENKD